MGYSIRNFLEWAVVNSDGSVKFKINNSINTPSLQFFLLFFLYCDKRWPFYREQKQGRMKKSLVVGKWN